MTPCIDHGLKGNRYVPRIPGPKPNPNGVTALAREFCVDTNVIYNIVRGNTYE